MFVQYFYYSDALEAFAVGYPSTLAAVGKFQYLGLQRSSVYGWLLIPESYPDYDLFVHSSY
jgi:hypothetical protein